jgi:hypothetical protein
MKAHHNLSGRDNTTRLTRGPYPFLNPRGVLLVTHRHTSPPLRQHRFSPAHISRNVRVHMATLHLPYHPLIATGFIRRVVRILAAAAPFTRNLATMLRKQHDPRLGTPLDMTKSTNIGQRVPETVRRAFPVSNPFDLVSRSC